MGGGKGAKFRICRNFDDLGDAEVRTSHILLLLLTLAKRLIILAVSNLQDLLCQKEKQFKMKFISGVTFWSRLWPPAWISVKVKVQVPDTGRSQYWSTLDPYFVY